MKDFIQILAEIVNNIHDFILLFVSDTLNSNATDKDLHFWIMGIIGIIIFLFVLFLSNLISRMRFGITILSFLYTFTVMVVLVFAIEIQQALTSRGNMEFQDAAVGLWGFIVFFLVFAAISSLYLLIKKFFKQSKKGNKRSPCS
ncbi:FeoB-associated Cys-rich membrane protein [Peribacillus sp. TH24]|uniref:FeoB-associated Cys-rich membrane protein n=1 Tax=Peribacillus sp. TH24 TaxID=2798483 RepID=UPI001912EF1F|nr:FeoB-associated Cys-rich membrane protein [Peribacillus sp. TH24]MBK5441497.1 FeoB-associated Cys-rich membrane protein [Peribacillus sp. TH24]